MQLPSDFTIPVIAPNPLISAESACKLKQVLGRVHLLASERLKSAPRHQKKYYDQWVAVKPLQPRKTDEVTSRIDGSHTVLETLNDAIYHIVPTNHANVKPVTAHFNRIKPATRAGVLDEDPRQDTSTTVPDASSEIEFSTESCAGER
ncbi:hypothetical protein D915_003881 [Fasciola hepatica]|uniref:Uncharacterized protein n=1 Tax=Fasciola hepatica TaxID=6192 RepID=A0A4E0RER0_FASHE|nr:hypothetical protein D915_003881 [Fasciola hepatica]